MAADNKDTDNNKPQENDTLPEVQAELSKVAGVSKQSIAILVLIFCVLLYLFFTLFINNKKNAGEPVAVPVTKPVQENRDNIPEIPKLPEPPKLEIPSTPPPPPLVAPTTVPLPAPITPEPEKTVVTPPPLGGVGLPGGGLVMSDEEKKRLAAKRRSSIVVIAGTEPAKTPEQLQQEAMFKDRGDMTFVLGHGKVIEAVLETAINSDLGGEVRAIVSRDVFSEANKVILIPKGSKVFGVYGTSIESYGRVYVAWTRIDLTNGYTIDMDSISVDNLGRKGTQGRVDNKFKERVTNAVLLSGFNIAFANALDKVIAPPINSQAAATNTAEATQIQNLAQSISTGSGDDNTKITMICTQVQAAITDKTSTAYTSMSQACLTAQNPASANTPAQRLAEIVQAVNAAAISLISTSATASTPTQGQQASTQAFTDVTNTLKEMITENEFKQTVTKNQGDIIKIYVTKDYKFPKFVLQKSRLLK